MGPERAGEDGLSPRLLLSRAGDALLDERRLLVDQELAAIADLGKEWVPSIAALAHEVRLSWQGPAVEIEGILAAKTGGCPEDCNFCSQSARFDSPVQAVATLSDEEVIEAARQSSLLGASEFCVVYAVRGPDEKLMQHLIRLAALVPQETGCNLAVSAGVLTPQQASRLASAGVHRYNHNLETARSFFPNVVSTHTWQERYETCLAVIDAKMELCSGVLLGLGESDTQRLELLAQLQTLDPKEVPINFLNPRPATPLAKMPLVEPLDAIRWISLFRLALPKAVLRYAGGREITLRELQSWGMTAGINALIVGNYLTTLGRAPEEDLAMLADLEMPIGVLSNAI